MNVRQPVQAGGFYEASPDACRRHAAKLLAAAQAPQDLPSPLYGGLVPHAGWMYSGSLAALTIKAIAAGGMPTVVLFGADHTGSVRKGEVYESGAWRTPLGDVPIDEELAAALLAESDCLRANGQAHAREHSLEVQIPLLQLAQPSVKIVPIAVPPTPLAVQIGRAVGKTLAAKFTKARIIGSTDLTHHGGHFGSPGGHGEVGVKWTQRNDRRMIDLIEALAADEVITEADAQGNACGAGAVAAAIAATKEVGATRGICLAYTNSYRVVHEKYPYELDDTTVGYASVVFA